MVFCQFAQNGSRAQDLSVSEIDDKVYLVLRLLLGAYWPHFQGGPDLPNVGRIGTVNRTYWVSASHEHLRKYPRLLFVRPRIGKGASLFIFKSPLNLIVRKTTYKAFSEWFYQQ